MSEEIEEVAIDEIEIDDDDQVANDEVIDVNDHTLSENSEHNESSLVEVPLPEPIPNLPPQIEVVPPINEIIHKIYVEGARFADAA